MSEENIYNADFYDMTIRTELPSAHIVVSAINDLFHPKSVIDIGCGCGIYLKAFYDLGITDIVGYDGSEWAVKKSLLQQGFIIQQDFTKSFNAGKKYDLGICVEVAEHIPFEFSDKLIDTITSCSETIIFTAAPPGQQGFNHINLQTREFWINKFTDRGFYYDRHNSAFMSGYFKGKDVTWWIWKNFMIFRKKETSMNDRAYFAKLIEEKGYKTICRSGCVQR